MLMRYVGSLTSLLPVAGIWIGPQRLLRDLGGTPGWWRIGRLGGAHSGLRVRSGEHTLLHTADELTRL